MQKNQNKNKIWKNEISLFSGWFICIFQWISWLFGLHSFDIWNDGEMLRTLEEEKESLEGETDSKREGKKKKDGKIK